MKERMPLFMVCIDVGCDEYFVWEEKNERYLFSGTLEGKKGWIDKSMCTIIKSVLVNLKGEELECYQIEKPISNGDIVITRYGNVLFADEDAGKLVGVNRKGEAHKGPLLDIGARVLVPISGKENLQIENGVFIEKTGKKYMMKI